MPERENENKSSAIGAGSPGTERRALTVRSVLFALLGIFLMSGLAGLHDDACRRPLMIGNHLPGGALTYMVLVGLVWNGIAGRISKRLALAPKELSVVLCATLVACFPPTSGLFRYFQRIIMLPWYYLPGNPEWSQYGLLDALRPDLFPAPYPGAGVPAPGSPDYAQYQLVYQGLFSGLGQGTWKPLWELPLRAWLHPLLFWGPLVFLVALCCISLQFVVHRQWAHHEQLGYPLAQVTGRFCQRADRQPGVPDIFRDRLFWWGFTPVFVYYMLDFLAAKYPAQFPSMGSVLPALKSWWLPLSTLFPDIVHAPQWWGLAGQSLFFTIVGAAYFVSTEISLTMGFSAFLVAGFGLVYYHMVGAPLSGKQLDLSRAGAYLGYTLILLYTGRTYFRAVFARAFGVRRTPVEGDDGTAVLAARVLVLSFLALIVVLRVMGLETVIAVFFSLLTLMLFFVFTRIICETGIPFLQATWSPPQALVGLVGPAAIGPKALVMLHWTNVVLTQDPRECLMPYVATGVKVADENGLSLRRVFRVIVASVAAALVVAFLASSYTQYNVSAMTDGWAAKEAVTGPFSECARLMAEMQGVGELEAASRGSFLTRLGLVRADPSLLRFFLLGAGLVIVCATMRFKFSKFPVHPVLFMVWGTTPATHSWYSFLVGWFLKTLVVRFGGGGVYQRLKPLFIGLIAGEVVFVGFHIVFNLVYLWIFHNAAPFGLSVLPT